MSAFALEPLFIMGHSKKISTLLVGLSLFLVACRKKPNSDSVLHLSAPQKTFSVHTEINGAPRSNQIAPEAEATGSNGPVQLTLRLFKKQVVARPLDTSIWVQIEMKNVGDKKSLIYDEIFFDGGPISDASRVTSGIFVEIVDANGKRAAHTPPFAIETEDAVDFERAKPDDSDIQEQVKEWFRQGLSREAAQSRLDDLFAKRDDERRERAAVRRYQDPHSALLPRQSTTTIPWAAHRGPPDAAIPGIAIGQFTELAHYDLKPGRYRIRAIYDHAVSLGMKRRFKLRDDPWGVRVETPFIDFEAVR